MIKPTSILEVKINNLIHNYNKFKKITKSEVGATIKANAYGIGVKEVFKNLMNNGCKHFLGH